jgi:hypothetical protein
VYPHTAGTGVSYPATTLSAVGKILLGAGLAVLGGILVAIYQEWRTEQLTTRLRRAERRDEAMLRLASLLAPVEATLDRVLAPGDHNRVDQHPGLEYEQLRTAIGSFESAWLGELSAAIRDEDISRYCSDIRWEHDRIFYSSPQDREGGVSILVHEDQARQLLASVVHVRALVLRALA